MNDGLDIGGCERLAVAALLQAIADVKSGRPCNGKCNGVLHRCADDARAWLVGDGADLSDMIGSFNGATLRKWAESAKC